MVFITLGIQARIIESKKAATLSHAGSQALEFLLKFQAVEASTPKRVLLSTLAEEVFAFVQANHAPQTFLLYRVP